MTINCPTFIYIILTDMSLLLLISICFLLVSIYLSTYVCARGAKKCLYLSIRSVMKTHDFRILGDQRTLLLDVHRRTGGRHLSRDEHRSVDSQRRCRQRRHLQDSSQSQRPRQPANGSELQRSWTSHPLSTARTAFPEDSGVVDRMQLTLINTESAA